VLDQHHPLGGETVDVVTAKADAARAAFARLVESARG